MLDETVAEILTMARIEAEAIWMSAWAAVDERQAQIEYTDHGAGIAEGSHSRIFEPFFTTRLGSGGSGLGRYIVYNLVTGVLGGTIKAYSSPNQGLAFTLTPPRYITGQSTLGIPT